MVDQSELMDLAERAVAKAVRAGAQKCDVVVCETRSISAELERCSVKQANSVSDPGMGVRVFHDGSPGFAFCTSFEQSAMDRAIEVAATFAKSGTKDPDFRDLPGKMQPSSVSGLHDSSVRDLSPEEAVALLIDMADRAGDDPRITSVNATVGLAVCRVALANSNGFSASQELSSVDVMVESVARQGEEMFSGFDGAYRRRLEAGMLDKVADTAREQAIKGLAHTKLETGDYPVVIAPFSVAYVLGEAIGDGANADSVQRGRSYLAGKVDTVVGADEITVVDDPTIEWGIRSTAFDGEGVPSRAKDLIVKGRLVSYLHDSYTAGKASTASTGNSSRGGGAWSYRTPPTIYASNLVFSPGNSSFDEMVRETQLGVYLRATFDSPNLATGEFSGLMMESYLIKDGEIGPSLRQSTIGIDIPTLLSRVDMLGKAQEKYFGVVAPAMRVSSARIAGSA